LLYNTNMDTLSITYPYNSSQAQGYLAVPQKYASGVIVLQEWWGLNENIKEMARSLAAEGYVVLAVDLFNGRVGKDANEARELSSKVRNNRVGAITNMKAAVGYLKNQNNVDKEKIASMGWCFGGGMSLQLALNEKLAATVIYYGNLETDKIKLSVIKWPVLGIFGDKDTSIPIDTVKKFEVALNELNIDNEIHIYEGVGHAFANPSGANYAPEQTKDAWEKTLRFLERNLKEKKTEEKIEQQDINATVKEDYCENDSDCVPNKCCHPSRLINKKFAPNCDEAICTAVCSGPLDCRKWRYLCHNNTCTVIFE